MNGLLQAPSSQLKARLERFIGKNYNFSAKSFPRNTRLLQRSDEIMLLLSVSDLCRVDPGEISVVIGRRRRPRKGGRDEEFKTFHFGAVPGIMFRPFIIIEWGL